MNPADSAESDRAPAAYTNVSLRSVLLCEESGLRATERGVCPIYHGDACLYWYCHPYDTEAHRWKKAKQWGLHNDGEVGYSERAAAYFDGLRDAKEEG